MRILLIISYSVMSLFAYAQKDLKVNQHDRLALEKINTLWEHYWNTHNMDSMGTLLKEDVDFINVAGVWMKGRNEVVKDHKDKHQTFRFKSSVWKTDSIKIVLLKPDIALMHVGWGISGDFETENQPRPPRHGYFTWILIKKNGKWLIRAVQNTNIRA